MRTRRAELRGDAAQRLRVAVDHRHVGAHADGDQRGVGAGDAAAEDDDIAGGTPGTPPSSTPRPPFSFSRQCAPTCVAMRPATSDIGVSSGSVPCGLGHGLVGDGGDARRHQVLGLLAVGARDADR